MKQLHSLLSLSVLSTLSLNGVSGELGICLKDLVFGQDAGNLPFTPREAISFRKARQPMAMPGNLYERDAIDGLEVVIAAGGGLIDISNINGVGSSSNSNQGSGAGSNSQSSAATTTHSTTSALASSSSSVASHSESSSEKQAESTPSDVDLPSTASGIYSQEPQDLVYTCNSEYIDFSQGGAMDKFSFVWCPQNAYQTGDSVVWRLTQECGTTMVYPWDFHYGKIEGRIRIGGGSGVVTSMLLLGPAPSDEIDFEWVGKATTQTQTMYYVQSHRVDVLPQVFESRQQDGSSADLSSLFQNYAVELNRDNVKWYINGKVVRTLPKTSDDFPTYASRARMGIWDGTQTSGWAGTVDWSHGPFTAEMQWFNFTPYC
ncbi:transglycosylase [Coemansia sp. RSA 1722]|nr:transglycosylase [Coemansia sp. RSA 485]KAJ2600954.1 transglycosylase [Coemansia sp. RSA 1721]KAJ2605690.1 transglycosylase [Coemansia sp. RSA 1722]KAJ2638981.1 transglycosylase [Coemansia sp. RSA 1286]